MAVIQFTYVEDDAALGHADKKRVPKQIVLHNLPSCLVVLRTRLRPDINPIKTDDKEPMPAHPRELRKECRYRRVRVALGRELAAAAKDQQQLG